MKILVQEKIVEIPVEEAVYRDVEVPVEKLEIGRASCRERV